MRWRFSYYTSEAFGRLISWPLAYASDELIEFTRALEGFKDLKGEMALSPQALSFGVSFRARNRRQIEEVKGIDSASEIYGSIDDSRFAAGLTTRRGTGRSSRRTP
jgi:hypothetical protein